MEASVATTNRDEALDKVYEEIEKNLIVSQALNFLCTFIVVLEETELFENKLSLFIRTL